MKRIYTLEKFKILKPLLFVILSLQEKFIITYLQAIVVSNISINASYIILNKVPQKSHYAMKIS